MDSTDRGAAPALLLEVERLEGRIEDALELCRWVTSTKAEIEAALEGRLPHDHPISVSRRELIDRGLN